jgi:hypothetical protein
MAENRYMLRVIFTTGDGWNGVAMVNRGKLEAPERWPIVAAAGKQSGALVRVKSVEEISA